MKIDINVNGNSINVRESHKEKYATISTLVDEYDINRIHHTIDEIQADILNAEGYLNMLQKYKDTVSVNDQYPIITNKEHDELSNTLNTLMHTVCEVESLSSQINQLYADAEFLLNSVRKDFEVELEDEEEEDEEF